MGKTIPPIVRSASVRDCEDLGPPRLPCLECHTSSIQNDDFTTPYQCSNVSLEGQIQHFQGINTCVAFSDGDSKK